MTTNNEDKENTKVQKLNRSRRKKHFAEIYNEIENIKIPENQISNTENNINSNKATLKSIELKLSALRLDQSESRMINQLIIAISGGAIGSILTLVIQFLLKNN